MTKNSIPTKIDLRREMSTRRKQISNSLRFQNSRLITKRLEGSDFYRKAKDILFFMSLKEEVQTWEMIQGAFQMGKRIYLPIVDPVLEEIRITRLPMPDIEFEKKFYGIQEPKKLLSDFVSAKKMDLVITPGLAFDFCGGRIGFGSGYYDRFLLKLKKHTKAVGVAFDFQVIKSVPQIPSDQKLDMLITEKRIFAC